MDIHTVHQIFVIVVMKWFRNKHSCSHSGEVDVFLMSLSLLIFLLAIHCSHLGPGCHRFTDGRPMDQILHKTTHHTQGQSATDSTVCPTITHSYYFQTQQNSYFQVTDSEMLGFLPKDKAYRIHQVALTCKREQNNFTAMNQSLQKLLPAPLGPMMAVNLLKGPIT
jgi:hypothetical protein